MQRIVVGVDGSENARAALHWAVDEAVLRGAELDVVMAWHEPYYGGTVFGGPVLIDLPDLEPSVRADLSELVATVVGDRQVTVREHVVRGTPAAELLAAAKGADLLVVGSRGQGGFLGLLLGSVSHQVAAHAPCPAVVVPPADSESAPAD